MRENAHDYFLSAKARYQNSGDEEDAADLYLAARNMAHHGRDVDWDDVLMKAKGQLEQQFRDPMTDELIPIPESELPELVPLIHESRFSTGRPSSVTSETGRKTGRMRTDIDRKGTMTSMGKHRSHIVGDDRRRVFAEPICSDFPGGAYYDKVLKRVQIPIGKRVPGGPTTTRPYEEKVRSFKHPLAHRDGIDAIREIRASRPRSSEQSGSRDEMAMQGWFIETTPHPKVYDHLLDYYHPDSPFFVGSETHGDRRIDAHSQEVVEKYLPSQTALSRGEKAEVKALFESGRPIFDLQDTEDRERLNNMRDQVGLYGPDAMGQWDLEQRTRLYTSRYNQWHNEYERRFPESNVSEDVLKKVFIDHLMLDIDGVGYTDYNGKWNDESVWMHLYNQDGEPQYALPRPGILNMNAGYKNMALSEDYANMRERRRAMGLEALRAGLICMGPDNADRLLHADQQKKFLKALQVSPTEVQKFILGPAFTETMDPDVHHKKKYLHQLIDDNGDERMFDPAHQTFHDGTPAPPIPVGAMSRYMEGHRLVMNTAMAKFMTNSTDTPHEADQPVLHPKESNLVKECLGHMLKTAHLLKYERERRERQKSVAEEREQILPDRKPLHRKLFQRSTQHRDDGDWDWDPVYDIPKLDDNPLETFHDLHKFLSSLRAKSMINNAEYIKMLLYSDQQMDGSQAYSVNVGRGERDFSTKRRSQNLKSAAPLLDSVWGVGVDEVTADQLSAEHEATPFAPTHKRLTRHGGLGYHSQDPNCVFGQWAPHELFPVRPSMLTMGTDYREIKKPGEPGYDSFIDGLGSLGPEIEKVQSEQYSTDNVAQNINGHFPIMQRYILGKFPSLGNKPFSESDIANQDARGDASPHNDNRGDRTAWDETTLDDLVRNTVSRRERELQISNPEDPLDVRSAGTLVRALDQHFPDEIAEGSLGYIPASPAHAIQYSTTVPPWVASNIASEKYVMPVKRVVPTEEERGKALGANIEKRKGQMSDLFRYQEYNIPPPRMDPSLAVRPRGESDENYTYSSGFHPYWQGAALNIAAMFYMGRHPNMRNSTLYPLSAAKATVAQQHGHKLGNLSDGDGSGTGKEEQYSFHHRQLGKAGVVQHEAALKDFEAKHAASLWGLGGTPPISYSDNEGAHSGKTVIAGHLDTPLAGMKDDAVPYLDMVRQMYRSRKGAFVDSHYLDHPNLYMPDSDSGRGTNHDLYAMLMSKPLGRRFGRKYDAGSRMYVDEQTLPLRPHWKDMLESRDVPEFGPHFYKVVRHNERDALKLTSIGRSGGDTDIFAPLDYLDKDTEPLEGGWENPILQSRDGKTTFDIAMLTAGRRVGDAIYPAMSAAESKTGVPDVNDMLTNEFVYIPESGAIVTTKDKNGNDMVLGPHPALLASQWADFAMAEKPSPHMREAMENLNSAAKDSIQHVSLPERDEPDLMYRTGVKAAGHHLNVRNHISAAHALRSAWPIAKAWFALNTIRNDEHFQSVRDSPFSEKLDTYERDYLAIPEGSTSKDAGIKRARIYKILELAHHFMSGHDSGLNKYIVTSIFGEVQKEGDPALSKQWNSVWGDAGLSIKDGVIQFNYRGHSPIAKYRTEVFTGADKHPLSTFSGDEMRDQVTGMDILTRYLEDEDSDVGRSMRSRGLDADSVNSNLDGLALKFPLGESSDFSKDRNAIASARQHEKGVHPSQWFRNIRAKRSRISAPSDHGKGKFTRYKGLMEDRGRHARRALAASRYVEGLSDTEFNGLLEEYGPLLWGQEDRLSPLGLIKRDLATKKSKGDKRAFPVHHHVMSTYSEDDDMRSKMKTLMEFIFAKGHYSDVHSYGNTERVGVERPVIGTHHSETSSVPSTMDFSRGKLSSFLFNPLTLRQFGVEMPKGMVDTSFASDERKGPGEMGRWPEGTKEEEVMGRRFDTFPTGTLPQTRYLEFHPDTLNGMLGYQLDSSDGNNFEQPPAAQDIAAGADMISTSMDALTDLDLLLKADKDDKGNPIPVKAMHRIFKLDDLEYFKGLSGDWVVSSWPIGERLIVTRKSNLVKAKDAYNEDYTLSNEVKKDVRAAHDTNFVIDCIWDGEVLHIMDILKAGPEAMENEHTKHRIRHLRANFSATENVCIPAPVNTKRVDNEGLERAVKDLFKEKGVKQVMLRDADSTYMKGESRHPKWLLMTKEKQVDVIVLQCEGGAALLGVGPLVDDDAKKMGNRSVKYEGKYYMDVGTLPKSGLQQGKFITVKTSNVVCKARNGLMIFTLHGARYVRDSESQAGDSLKTLELLSGENSENVPHKLRISKGSVHIEFPVGHVVYDTEPFGHSFIVKSVDAPSPYMEVLAESQREYWEPLAAILLRSEVESKKANVVPEPPANHDKKPKKVLKPTERLLKDPEVTKQILAAVEMLEQIVKEKVTFTGPKGLGIDFASPVESPSGPTDNTEPYNLPDHDPAHRQEKGGDCWCGAKEGQMCEQGTGVKIDVCPRFSSPDEEKEKKHIKINVS